MKIIATVDDRHFLIQATRDEIAKIMGYAYESQMPKIQTTYGRDDKMAVGMELPVTELYQACQSVKDSSEEIAEAIKVHKKLIANMERFSAAILPAAEIIKSKEPKK